MGISAETAYVFNTFFLSFCGVLVMFMAAGFAMLEAGMVRSKSVAVILIKNIGIYSIASILFYLVGYNLMYANVESHHGLFGTFSIFEPDDSAAHASDFSAGHSSGSDWFFQMVFVATAVSIVSGALAERIKLIPFFVFAVFLVAFIYPVAGSWKWGGGWLESLGFADFAGSTLVHGVGGWTALAGALILGPRRGRFDKEDKHEKPDNLQASSLPLVALGTFVLWFGWFGFNGGSQLAIASVADASAVAKILANTNTAAAAGVLSIIAFYLATTGRIDVPMVLNGALAGLVAITAEPLTPSIGVSALVGAAGAFVMLGASFLMDKLQIDDVVGAVPTHLASGIFGTLVVAFTNPDVALLPQVIGVASIGGFTFVVSLVLWLGLKAIMGGIRLHWSHEELGSDMAELGMRAYNFGPSETYTVSKDGDTASS